MDESNQDPQKPDQKIVYPKQQSSILESPIILGDLTLGSPTTQATIGAAGGASAQPATPLGYLIVQVGTTTVAVPYHNVA